MHGIRSGPATVNKARATLASCSGAHVLHDGLTDVLYVLLPVIAQAFGLNYSQVGLIRSANKAALAVFQLPAGVLAERYGDHAGYARRFEEYARRLVQERLLLAEDAERLIARANETEVAQRFAPATVAGSEAAPAARADAGGSRR